MIDYLDVTTEPSQETTRLHFPNEELKKLCRLCLEALAEGREELLLVLGRKPSGRRIRLAGKLGGPLGEVHCVNSDGETVARFNAYAILNWMAKKELVTRSSE